MTDIEQEFFKVFGIDKKCLHPKDCAHKGVCKGVVACEHYNYPEITDRVLLELIDILTEHYRLYFWSIGNSKCLDICGDSRTNVLFRTCNTLKNNILNSVICMQEENKILKQQVQSLFGEGKE